MTPTAITLLLLLAAVARGEHVRHLEVSEGAAVGTRVGFIGDGAIDSPPYLIVPVSGPVDSDLAIDQNTGEIRTRVSLDREARPSYSLVAIPMSGDNVKVVVKVLDENDNSPRFPQAVLSIEFPENTPRDVKRTLHPARDSDLDLYNTQRYNIVSGNVNNAFRLSSHRERDGVLYLDLQINGFLDRETTPGYTLVIEALDGGAPPLRGEMTVNITIQDVNDNQPIFNQSRYFATVPENATVGTSVLQVFATDADSQENGQVEYSINRRQSDRDNMFKIDPTTGLIAVNKPLDFEAKELHELVIMAKDHGLQPLETTAFVSIKVTDVNDNQPTINVIFLSDDATPKISESAQPGEFVARLSVNDPDSKTEYSNINVTLSGGDGHFGLTTRDNIIYLVIVSLPLDRESTPNYTLNVVATDTGTPPLHASRTINLMVTDINDNAPEFEQPVYQANVMEVSDPGTSVIQVMAADKDEGNNSAITYSLLDINHDHSWFQIDPRSGLVTTRAHVDCESDPVPRLTVIATDNGFPPLSSSAAVLVTIHDVNDNEPIFDQSFYNVSVAENEATGRCILKVSATDPDCGVNAMVNYTLVEGQGKLKEFEVRSATGDICITSGLDYESRNVYEFPVIATDRGGLSTTAMVKIQITDVNDNRPIFYPRIYNVSLREGDASSSATVPVVVVATTDPDSGKFGSVTYKVVSGNEAGMFRIDRVSGEIFVSRPNQLSTHTRMYHLNISAVDGGNLKSTVDAEVFISVIDLSQRPPIFEHPRYTYSIGENARRDTVVGSVRANVKDSDGPRNIRYSIYSGDPDGLFRIDPSTGVIRTSSILDHETRSSVLLNVQATNGNPPVYGHTQVNIEIEDVNDNAPEFESNVVRISVAENVEIGVALYAAHARDRDSGPNGVVRYEIATSGGGGATSGGLFDVDPKLGHLTLTRRLDYETSQRHSLVVTATDGGIPRLSANLTVLVEVQDVNDNAPVFERSEYSLSVMESLPVNSQVLQVTAVDLDTGNNARLTYRLLNSSVQDSFAVFPNSGWIYIRSPLDRETRDRYELIVGASDNGTPSQSATAKVLISILDTNDNDPAFKKESYEFTIEENMKSGSFVGQIAATDRDSGVNAAIRYNLIPGNTSFEINSLTGELTTRKSLDRESKETYDLVAEARDRGVPARSTRVPLKITVLDVNDNAPVIVDPQEDFVSVREEQPPGTEVARIRAVDADKGQNASITYSIVKKHDSDGAGIFQIDPVTGVIRTRVVLDHEDKTVYTLVIAATDKGRPQVRQTEKMLRVEVLDLNDNRPTFTSSSLVFRVREDAKIGHIVGSVSDSSEVQDQENLIGGQITYTLTSLTPDTKDLGAFDIDRSTGSLVVARELDRESESEYRLEVRALDTSAMNNPQSSAITVKIDVIDVNDNPPHWSEDPVTFSVSENAEVGTWLYNFTARDNDSGGNGEIRYTLVQQFPDSDGDLFTIDSLTGTLILRNKLDYELVQEYTVIVQATDQSLNISSRLSSTITARIIVMDFNDNIPKFVVPHPGSTVLISEDTVIGARVTDLVAVDSDSGDNGRVTYVISGGNDLGLFALGYDTGVLTLARSLLSDLRVYVLNVTATDHGTPTRQVSLEVKLSVEGSEEAPPRFLNSLYQANVPEDTPVGSFVTKVSARSGFNEEGGRNISFYIPEEIADNVFRIDSNTARIYTTRPLDRETRDSFTIPVYVTDTTATRTLFDFSTLIITVTDVNDHAPEFKSGSCHRFSIPENNDLSVVHTVVAKDLDIGQNGEIAYGITSGNTGNRFSIDMRTGELSARPLDRETHSRYHLTVTAQDRGRPSLSGTCNMTVIVEDQNDNDPKFDISKYYAEIPEDIAVDTSILKVHAFDIDLGTNGNVIYSLANESQWLFRIDNKTGVITTAGLFDREVQGEFNFMVVATDSGRYNARSQKVPVSVHVEDVNDNNPVFTHYPFRERVTAYKQPGQSILKVSAKDADQGTNAEIVYSLVNDNGKFRINPNTGVLTSTQTLASDNGKVIHLNILATDKGNPPRSSQGLVEVIVGDISEGSPELRFQNSTYTVTIPENTDSSTEILQVSAVRTDGRRVRIRYSFGTGNQDNIFSVDPETGSIQIRDPKNLDYELHKTIQLVIEARTDASPPLHGYCNVIVNLGDINDNAPKFTQQQYSASVWEGNTKGAFVLQVMAFDSDEGKNSQIRYHIVDGNHDNAFKIEPAFSGVLKTNIVLDREIRDTYKLTVIAIDEGVPPMTGNARILINVVDVNDNQPTFPAPGTISVSEATEIGTVLTTVTANDVDTNPPLTYYFAPDDNNMREDLSFFSIDRFSGKVILRKPLDFETRQEYLLNIVASDTAYTAQTALTIKVTDVNDNAPMFSQIFYHANLPDGQSSDLSDILTVNTTDLDSGDNGLVTYSLNSPLAGFSVGHNDGVLRVNLSSVSSLTQDLQLAIKATDSGKPPLSSLTSVRIKINSRSSHISSSNKRDYNIHIPENSPKGTTVLRLGRPTSGAQKYTGNFRFLDGNTDGTFQLSNPSGTLIVVKKLDRERQDTFNLKITVGDEAFASNYSMIHVTVRLDDSNDNAPVFTQGDYEITVSETTALGTSIKKILATDSDQLGTVNSEITYEITSGNDDGLFRIEESAGDVIVNKSLDYDSGHIQYNLVLRACDRGEPQHLCTLNTFTINLQDENDNTPRFPVMEYLEMVAENEPVGTSVFTARAIDLDKGPFGNLTYSIVSATEINDSWKLFHIDPTSGSVTTNSVFDYEQNSRYIFVVKATDIGGKSTNVKVRVMVESKDEFPPQFTEKTYKLTLPTSTALPGGYVIGYVTATDRDKGPDGRLIYQLNHQDAFFKINRTTGAVIVKRKITDSELGDLKRKTILVVTANSGRQGSLSNTSFVEITLDPLADPGTNLAINNNETTVAAANGGIADWALGLLIALILLIITFGAVFVFLHMRNKRNKKINKPNLSNDTVGTSNNYVDPSAFDTIPIRGPSAPNNGQFAPPKYDEIPPYGAGGHAASSNSGNATTSELSGSEQSGSSGRGSAEEGDDGEDEEIRMINEGPLQRDSGIHQIRQNDDDDNMSDVSVRNTQEYLARLGIVNNNSTGVPQASSRLCQDRAGSSKDTLHHHQTVPLDIFDEEGAAENDMTLIYAKLNDVTTAGSDRASSTDEGVTVGPTMEHVMAMSYGEVPTVVTHHQPSMNGSLSSIVHSEEELAGSYNWDYLLDWGPQYQPLAHVFSEIARLKDDSASVKSGASASSSVRSKTSGPVKSVPPPLITGVAPRSIPMPVLNSRTSHHSQMMMLPRSPISHDASGATFSTSAAMSPSFSPSLSPLATKSPSISPLVTPGLSTSHHVMGRQPPQTRGKAMVDAELRI